MRRSGGREVVQPREFLDLYKPVFYILKSMMYPRNKRSISTQIQMDYTIEMLN